MGHKYNAFINCFIKESVREQMNEKKKSAKYKILNYMLHKGEASKVELAKQLELSMPTVLSNVNDLIAKGIIVEVGELESTGGRKAKSLGLCKDYRYSIGVSITANHIGMVLMNLGGEIVKQKRIRVKFEPDVSYCAALAQTLKDFYKGETTEEEILGVGISLPGIVNDKMLSKSHALKLENYSLKMIEQFLPFPAYFENDANAAMLAENPQLIGNAIYLSLNNTLGGAVCMNGKLFTGQNRKAGEFGHMLLFPEGKKCYCGKRGCADAYCAANALLEEEDENLEDFMNRIGKEEKANHTWDSYMENLAILISNLRMAFDTDIILGGDVGGYLSAYMLELGQKVFQYNLFDKDLSYLKNCSYKKEASAVGVAKYFFEKFIDQI